MDVNEIIFNIIISIIQLFFIIDLLWWMPRYVELSENIGNRSINQLPFGMKIHLYWLLIGGIIILVSFAIDPDLTWNLWVIATTIFIVWYLKRMQNKINK